LKIGKIVEVVSRVAVFNDFQRATILTILYMGLWAYRLIGLCAYGSIGWYFWVMLMAFESGQLCQSLCEYCFFLL